MSGKLTKKVEWTGMRLTVQDLRDLVEFIGDVRGETIIHVNVDKHVDQRDPGGQITMKMEL